MNNIFTNDSFTIRDTPNKLYIKYIQNEYISNFELLGIFDDESSEWIFDKTNTNAISFINKILNLDIKTLYTVSNPQQILMNYASASSVSTSTASSSSVENKQYPFKLYDCTFECAISNIVYKILIADYNEKCISMHIQSTNPILSQIGKENKLFSTNYDIIYTYGPIAEINALEITGTIKFKCENLINKMIVYSV